MKVILLGAPGAGKGTQCKRVVDRYGLVHLSSGDILRQERLENSELGRKAQSFMDSGALVPDEIIVEMMIRAIKRSLEEGYILDGFPRTINQAAELDRSFAGENEHIDVIINLLVDDSVVFERITGRRSCPECGAVYHIKNLKPKVDGICDNDGAELIQRTDDTLEVVKNRLKTYYEQTEPVVDYYKANKDVYEVDANGDANEVSNFIFQKLDALAETQNRMRDVQA